MSTQQPSSCAEVLAKYIQARPEFKIVTSIDGNYGHMGATLVDAVLQPGVKYKTVVRPRVQRLLRDYPEVRTTSGFARLLGAQGPQQLLDWNGKRKLKTLKDLIDLLLSEKVETEDDFRAWVGKSDTLDRLRKIKGIKDKSVHYIQILLGVQTVAVDRHLFRFLKEAGFSPSSYDEAHTLIGETADLLGIQASLLDHSIWRYMSERIPCA